VNRIRMLKLTANALDTLPLRTYGGTKIRLAYGATGSNRRGKRGGRGCEGTKGQRWIEFVKGQCKSNRGSFAPSLRSGFSKMTVQWVSRGHRDHLVGD